VRRPRPKKAAGCALVVGVIGALPITSAAGSESDEPGRLPVKPSALTGQAPCHAGKHNGFRLYCHVAVEFKLDARKFSFEGGSCGHGHGEWGFSAGPGAVTLPAKGWTLSVHFGTQDYGKSVDKDGKYGPANVYDINVSMNIKAGVFVPPQSSLGVVDHAATVTLSSGMRRGSYRARVA
jgi:Putative MetA-pathway of phenol degradation